MLAALYLAYISRISPLNLPKSRVYLACISPTSRRDQVLAALDAPLGAEVAAQLRPGHEEHGHAGSLLRSAYAALQVPPYPYPTPSPTPTLTLALIYPYPSPDQLRRKLVLKEGDEEEGGDFVFTCEPRFTRQQTVECTFEP